MRIVAHLGVWVKALRRKNAKPSPKKFPPVLTSAGAFSNLAKFSFSQGCALGRRKRTLARFGGLLHDVLADFLEAVGDVG